jgi:hypothetical protein
MIDLSHPKLELGALAESLIPESRPFGSCQTHGAYVCRACHCATFCGKTIFSPLNPDPLWVVTRQLRPLRAPARAEKKTEKTMKPSCPLNGKQILLTLLEQQKWCQVEKIDTAIIKNNKRVVHIGDHACESVLDRMYRGA